MKKQWKKTDTGIPYVRFTREKSGFLFEAHIFSDGSGFVSFSIKVGHRYEVLYQSQQGKIKDWLKEVTKKSHAYDELEYLLIETTIKLNWDKDLVFTRHRLGNGGAI